MSDLHFDNGKWVRSEKPFDFEAEIKKLPPEQIEAGYTQLLKTVKATPKVPELDLDKCETLSIVLTDWIVRWGNKDKEFCLGQVAPLAKEITAYLEAMDKAAGGNDA